MFIDKVSGVHYLPVNAGKARFDPAACVGNKRNELLPYQNEERLVMNGSMRDFAMQIAVTLALAGLLGAVLFGVADFATQGVIIP